MSSRNGMLIYESVVFHNIYPYFIKYKRVFRNTMKTFLRKALGCDPIKTPAMVY